MYPTKRERNFPTRNIICDTDAGSDVDDFLALAYLISVAPKRLKMVSTTYGPVETRARAITTLFMGMGVKVPVISGVRHLLTTDKPIWLTGGEKYLVREDLKVSDAEMLESYLKYDNFTVLAIGPLTNIATLLQDSRFRKQCSKIVIMGGSLNPGELIPEIEHNFKCDPVATKIVLESKVPKVIVPVDLTLQFPMTEEYQTLFKESQKEYIKLLSAWMVNWRNITNAFDPPFRDSVHWHDPITAAYIFHPELFRTEDMQITVDEYGGLKTGQGTTITVCTHMDAQVIDILAKKIFDHKLPLGLRLNKILLAQASIFKRTREDIISVVKNIS